MPSFDIVSQTDMQEVDNAVNSVIKEIKQRYDFKDSKSSVERKDKEITILADDDYKLKAVGEMMKVHFTRRKIDPRAMDIKSQEQASGNMIRQKIEIKNGIDQETAKKIVKEIKDMKFKVQASIKGEELRVEGKKRDDLQEVIAHLRSKDYNLPLQFTNYRD